MKRSILNRSTGLATLALTASLALTACGSEDSGTAADDASSPSETTSESAEPTPTEEPTESESAASGAGEGTFGEGCAAIPTDASDPGSFEGMATEPVATAASGNPLLKTLVAAVTEAGLVDTLNSAEGITVFAPTDDAFAKLPKKDLKAVLANKELLTQILTHHVVGETLTPENLAGEFDTLAGDKLTVKGSGEKFTADAEEKANVICGNIQTANATVYVIDTVMMPQM